jgi:hypothetical protein
MQKSLKLCQFFKGSVTLLFSTTTGENLNFPTTPGII